MEVCGGASLQRGGSRRCISAETYGGGGVWSCVEVCGGASLQRGGSSRCISAETYGDGGVWRCVEMRRATGRGRAGASWDAVALERVRGGVWRRSSAELEPERARRRLQCRGERLSAWASPLCLVAVPVIVSVLGVLPLGDHWH